VKLPRIGKGNAGLSDVRKIKIAVLGDFALVNGQKKVRGFACENFMLSLFQVFG
jgi:hypothetical protein